MTDKIDEIVAKLPDLIARQQPKDDNGNYSSKYTIEHSIMLMCLMWSQVRSKDPNTKVGAAVYDNSTGSLHLGYNGFPADYPDAPKNWDNRTGDVDSKYNYVIHAEANAIRKAYQANCNMSKSALFTTNFPCHHCVKDFIAPSGIKHVYYLNDYPPDEISIRIMDQASIEYFKMCY